MPSGRAHAEILEQRAEAQQIFVRMKENHPDLPDRRQHDVVLQLYRDNLPDYQDEQRRGERQQNPVKKKFHRSLRKPPRGMSRAAGISVYLAVFVNWKSNTWS